MGNWSSQAGGDLGGGGDDRLGLLGVEQAEVLLTCAQAALSRPIARIWVRSSGRKLMGKFSTARCVCARHSASMGT